jgi:hypothetical protein
MTILDAAPTAAPDTDEKAHLAPEVGSAEKPPTATVLKVVAPVTAPVELTDIVEVPVAIPADTLEVPVAIPADTVEIPVLPASPATHVGWWTALRGLFATSTARPRPERRHYPARSSSYLENSAMAREMFRL